MSDELIAIAVEFLMAVKEELDPYTTRKGEVQPTQSGAILLTPSHIQFARYGRGPGKQPPLDPILEWVQRKGVRIGNLSEKGTAWAVIKSIAKNGTKNWVPNAPNALEESLKKNFEDYQQKMSRAFIIAIDDQITNLTTEAMSIHKRFDC